MRSAAALPWGGMLYQDKGFLQNWFIKAFMKNVLRLLSLVHTTPPHTNPCCFYLHECCVWIFHCYPQSCNQAEKHNQFSNKQGIARTLDFEILGFLLRLIKLCISHSIKFAPGRWNSNQQWNKQPYTSLSSKLKLLKTILYSLTIWSDSIPVETWQFCL